MSKPVVVNDHGITRSPSDRETIVFGELEPQLPLFPSDVSVISEGHLDRSIFGSKFLDSGPGVEPREVVSNV